MAFIRIHTKGFNTDWIVRWEDDVTEDTLRIVVAREGALSLHGDERTALLAYLTRTSLDLVGPSMPFDHADAGTA